MSTSPPLTPPSRPLVSIAVPMYNGRRFIETALRSVFAQRFRDLELVVVDDASSDESYAVVSRLCAREGMEVPLRLLRNDRRIGLFANWNRAIEACHGKYILIFHQDDVLDAGMVERSVQAFEAHPDLGFVHCAYRCVDEHGADLPPWSSSPYQGRAGGTAFLQSLINENFVCCPSVMVPRAIYDRLGTYDTRFAFSADLEMWLRIASHADVFYCPDIGVRYRLHTGQATETFRTRRAARAELESLVAALVGMQARRHMYPALWRRVVRDTLWGVRRHLRAAPLEAAWGGRMLAGTPGDATRACRDALLERMRIRSRADQEATKGAKT